MFEIRRRSKNCENANGLCMQDCKTFVTMLFSLDALFERYRQTNEKMCASCKLFSTLITLRVEYSYVSCFLSFFK